MFKFSCFCSYLAQESACTGTLNEKSDIYSFGILIMEIVSGRLPVDHSQPQVQIPNCLTIYCTA